MKWNIYLHVTVQRKNGSFRTVQKQADFIHFSLKANVSVKRKRWLWLLPFTHRFWRLPNKLSILKILPRMSDNLTYSQIPNMSKYTKYTVVNERKQDCRSKSGNKGENLHEIVLNVHIWLCNLILNLFFSSSPGFIIRLIEVLLSF